MDKILDTIHIKVHALRMQDGYKPTKFEWELNKLIADTYASECQECKDKSDRLKYEQAPSQKKFFGLKI